MLPTDKTVHQVGDYADWTPEFKGYRVDVPTPQDYDGDFWMEHCQEKLPSDDRPLFRYPKLGDGGGWQVFCLTDPYHKILSSGKYTIYWNYREGQWVLDILDAKEAMLFKLTCS